MLEVAAADAALYAPVREAAETALRALPGVERAQVVLTAEEPAGGASAGPANYRVSRSGAEADACAASAATAGRAAAGSHGPHAPAPRRACGRGGVGQGRGSASPRSR